MQTYHLTPGQGTDLMNKVLSIPLISFCTLSSRMWADCSQVSIPQTNTTRATTHHYLSSLFSNHGKHSIYKTTVMKLAMPKVLDQGAKRPSLDTSRTLGILMTSGRHSERPKVQGKEGAQSDSRHEPVCLLRGGEMRGTNKSLKWSSLTTGSLIPSYSGGSASVSTAEVHKERKRDKEDRGLIQHIFQSLGRKRSLGTICSALSNFSNQAIPADSAPSLSGCL